MRNPALEKVRVTKALVRDCIDAVRELQQELADAISFCNQLDRLGLGKRLKSLAKIEARLSKALGLNSGRNPAPCPADKALDTAL
jgi:hypothetical protein